MSEPVSGYGRPDEATRLGAAADDSVDLLADRRRPGRTEVSPTLVPLLRGEPEPGTMQDIVNQATLVESDWDTEEAMKPARGIAFGLLLSIPLWAALLATCHVAIRLFTHS